jgi:hypothetical protein
MMLNNFDFKIIHKNKGTDFIIKADNPWVKNAYFEFLIVNKFFDDIQKDLIDPTYNGHFQTYFQKLVSNGADISEEKYSNLIDELIKTGSYNFMISYLILCKKEIPEKIKKALAESYNKPNDVYSIFNILFNYRRNLSIDEIPKFILDYILYDTETETKILSYVIVKRFKPFIDFFLKDFIETYDNFIDNEVKKEKMKKSDYHKFYHFKFITVQLYANDNADNKIFLDFINSEKFKKYFKLYNKFVKDEAMVIPISDKEFIKIINHLLRLNESFKSFFYK